MFDQLMKVSRGFKLIYVGILICIIAVVLFVIAIFMLAFAMAGRLGGGAGGAGGAAGGPAALAAFGGAGIAIMVLFFLVVMGGAITSFVGKVFCLAIPQRAGPAKQLIVGSIILEVISLFVQITTAVLAAAQILVNEVAQQVVSLGGYVSNFVAIILFLLFTKHAARFIRSRDLESNASLVLKLVVATAALYFLAIVIVIGTMLVGGVARGAPGAPGGAMAGMCIGGCLMLVALIMVLVSSIMYIILMVRMSAGVARYAKKVRRERLDDEDEDWADEDRDDRDDDDDDRDDDDDDRDDEDDRHSDRWERRDR